MANPYPIDLSNKFTPTQWEQSTGNKLLSYTTRNGILDTGNMKFTTAPGTRAQSSTIDLPQSQRISQFPQDRSQSLLQSSYEQVMGRASSAPAGQYKGGSQGLTKGGFYGSMPALEAASMRLADAALGREMLAGEYKGFQETGLQQLRGSQETGLQQLRGSQEYGLAQLTGSQQERLQASRLQAESESAKFQQKNQIDSEIRALQLERQRVGATRRSDENVWLYNNLGNQIRALQNQRNAIR
jgi:hypothetical protein